MTIHKQGACQYCLFTINHAILIPSVKNEMLNPILCHLNNELVNNLLNFYLRTPWWMTLQSLSYWKMMLSHSCTSHLSSRASPVPYLWELQTCLSTKMTTTWSVTKWRRLQLGTPNHHHTHHRRIVRLIFGGQIVNTVTMTRWQIIMYVNTVATTLFSCWCHWWLKYWYIPGVLCEDFTYQY